MFDPPDERRFMHLPDQIPFLPNGSAIDDMSSLYYVSLNDLRISLKSQLPDTVIRVFRVPHAASKRK